MMNAPVIKSVLAALPPLATGPVARSASIVMLLRLFNIALGFAIAAFLARLLGVGGYGVFAFGVSIALLISTPARLGLQTLIVRSVPAFTEREDWSSLRGLWIFSLIICAIISTLAAGITASLAQLFISNPDMKIAAFIGTLIAPGVAFCTISQNFLRGQMKPFQAYAPEFIILQSILFLFISILTLSNQVSAISALIAYALSWIIALSAALFWSVRAMPALARTIAPTIHWRPWLLSCGALTLGSFIAFTIGRVEPIALAAFSTPEEIGIFAIAFRFAAFVTFPGFALSSGLGPAISQLTAQQNHAALSRRIILGARFGAIGALCASVAVVLLSWVALPILDAEFSRARITVLILTAGFLLQTATGRPFETISILGHAGEAARAGLVSMLLFFVLLFTLAPKYGANGAALACSSAVVFHSILLCYRLQKSTGFRCDAFAPLNRKGA